jgi:hypothetical protein
LFRQQQEQEPLGQAQRERQEVRVLRERVPQGLQGRRVPQEQPERVRVLVQLPRHSRQPPSPAAFRLGHRVRTS